MGIILDLVILAILVLSIIFGYKKGLISAIYNLCAFLIALVVTAILLTPITNAVLENTSIDEKIQQTLEDNLEIQDKSDNEETKQTGNVLTSYIEQYISEPITEATNEAIEAATQEVSEKIVSIGVAIALFIVIRIILILVKFIANGIAKMPIIKQFNKLGGTAYGVLRGLFVVYVLLAILFFVVSINDSGIIATAINSSFISKTLYSNNIILNIIL